MGTKKVLPSQQNRSEADVNFSKMDPTIILRLHSIISGLDVFQLKEKFDYKIRKSSQKIISMNIPAEMVNELRGLTNIELEPVLSQWRNSKEVKLSQWTKSRAEVYLHSLLNSSKQNFATININMHLNEEPIACS